MWNRRVVVAASLLLILGAVLLRAWDPTLLQIARHRSFDAYQRLAPARHTAVPTIVDIDEASIAAFGQWPWPRSLIADLIDRIAAAGAVVVALNVVFPEPDRSSPRGLAERIPDLSDAARDLLLTLPDNDATLAAVLARVPSVLGQPIALAAPDHPGLGPARKASYAKKGSDPRPFLLGAEGFIRNLPVLEQAAVGIGAIVPFPDPDEVVRRPPLIIRVGEDIYPALALETLRVALRQRSIVIAAGPGGLDWLRVGPFQIPTDDRGRLWIRFDPHRPDLFVSAKDVLAGTVSADRLRGRMVLVGISAAGIQDVRSTPIDALATVEIQAQILATIIGQRALTRPPWTATVEMAAVAVIGLVLVVLLPLIGPIGGFLAGFAIMTIAAAAVWSWFVGRGVLIDITYTAATTFLLYTALTTIHFLREQSQRRQVRTAFSQYLAPALVARLAEHPESLKIGGEMKSMTMLFSDVRGFTAIAERLREDPRGLTRLINLYFTAMTDRILEFGGTIDKYMGDAIMAFWNAPLDDPRHPQSAAQAALEMLDGLRKLNHKLAADPLFAAAGVGALGVGIGINTGECLVGNVGSQHRFNYSVIGDPVNLAARLEEQSKTYGVRIVLGEATHAATTGLATLELDLIRARGRVRPERIYGLFGQADLAADAGFAKLAEHNTALLTACRRQEWGTARAALADCRHALVGLREAFARSDVDLAAFYTLYEKRIAFMASNPPIAAWDGVFPAPGADPPSRGNR